MPASPAQFLRQPELAWEAALAFHENTRFRSNCEGPMCGGKKAEFENRAFAGLLKCHAFYAYLPDKQLRVVLVAKNPAGIYFMFPADNRESPRFAGGKTR